MSRTLRISAIGLLAAGLMGSVALAATNPPKGGGGYGYGYGYGPPGHRACKPGWGHGDKNHEHCGPPGLEKKGVFPGKGKPFALLIAPAADPASSTTEAQHSKGAPKHADAPNVGTSTTTGAPHKQAPHSSTTTSSSSSTVDPTTSTVEPSGTADKHGSSQGQARGNSGSHGHSGPSSPNPA